MFVSVVTNALDRHKLWRMSAIHQRLQIKLCPRRFIFFASSSSSILHIVNDFVQFFGCPAKYIPSWCHYEWWICLIKLLSLSLWYKSTPMSSENIFFQLNDNDNESEDCSRLFEIFKLGYLSLQYRVIYIWRILIMFAMLNWSISQNQCWLICSNWV